jgi:hypothetical protein
MGSGNWPLKKCLARFDSLLKLAPRASSIGSKVVAPTGPQAFAHGDRPGTMRLRDFIAQALKGFDMREEFLSESERLLARIGERGNVPFATPCFSFSNWERSW